MKRNMHRFMALVLGLGLGLGLVAGVADRAQATDEPGNMVSFRGGLAGANSDRDGNLTASAGTAGGDSGYYVGAALDLLLSKHVWGMMSGTWALGEIGVEFKRFNSSTTGSTTNHITMLNVDIAPKLKFWEGSRLRPWIIPVGLDFIVISPPSSQVSYLDVGALFGAGVEYQLWQAFRVGLDARYHLAAGYTNTVNNYGTLGGYLGISF